jgi:hypothetical protein
VSEWTVSNGCKVLCCVRKKEYSGGMELEGFPH